MFSKYISLRPSLMLGYCTHKRADEQADIPELYCSRYWSPVKIAWWCLALSSSSDLHSTPSPGDLELTLFALPDRLGGFGVGIPSENVNYEFHSSSLITSALCDRILSQDLKYGNDIIEKQLEAKAQVHRENHERTVHKSQRPMNISLSHFRKLLTLLGRKVLRPGWPPYPWWIMALLLTSRGFMIWFFGYSVWLDTTWDAIHVCM